jgi:AcrR family transcriptional regulator
MSGTRKRARPRTGLSRDAILEAAMEIVGEGSVESLTMAALAERLGVGVMTLYWYFDSKEALTTALTARVSEAITADAPSLDDGAWDTVIMRHFSHERAQILKVPGLGALLLARGRLAVSPEDSDVALAALERQLAIMRDAGFSAEVAARGIQAASQYTLGFSMRELLRLRAGSDDDQRRRWADAIERLGGPDHDLLSAAAPFLASSGGTAQFEFGLELIIDGLRAHLSAARGDRDARDGR